MIIESLPEVRVVDDYDFQFVNGAMMPVTVDQSVGDTIEFGPDRTKIHLAEKPSIQDSSKKLPAEDILVFNQHVITVQHRKRELLVKPELDIKDWGKLLSQAIN